MVVKCCSLKVTVFLSRQGCSGMMNEAIHKSEVFKHLQVPLRSTGILDYWDLASKTWLCMRLRIPRAIGLLSPSVYLMKYLERLLQKCWLFGCMFVMGDLISKAQGPGLCQRGCLEVELGRSLSGWQRSAEIPAKTARQDSAFEGIPLSSPLQVSPYTKSWLVIGAQRNEWAQKNVTRRECYNSTGKSYFFFFNFSIQLIFYCGLGAPSHRNASVPLQHRTVGWSINTAPACSCLEALCVSAFLKVSHGFVSCECAFSPAHSWNA